MVRDYLKSSWRSYQLVVVSQPWTLLDIKLRLNIIYHHLKKEREKMVQKTFFYSQADRNDEKLFTNVYV